MSRNGTSSAAVVPCVVVDDAGMLPADSARSEVAMGGNADEKEMNEEAQNAEGKGATCYRYPVCAHATLRC